MPIYFVYVLTKQTSHIHKQLDSLSKINFEILLHCLIIEKKVSAFETLITKLIDYFFGVKLTWIRVKSMTNKCVKIRAIFSVLKIVVQTKPEATWSLLLLTYKN